MSDLDQAPNEDIQNREIYREIGLEALQSSSGMMDRIDDLSVVKGNNVTISRASIKSEVNIYPASRYSQELPRSELNKFGERLADEVNKRTRKECEKFATAALNIRNRKATKISCQVLPELARTDFFEGATALEEVNYSATTTTNITIKKREAQVFVKEIHNQGRYVLVVGAAGSGKTTLAKRYSLLALNNETTQHFKMVHFINIRDTGTEKCTPKKFLLEDHLIGESLRRCVEHGYTWLQYEENQESVLFIFDGLDTAPWDLDDTHHPPMGYNDAKMPVTIMFNILRGHLFPKCSILLTSREYGVSRLKPELRPNASITMRGLAPKDMKSLVEDLGGDRSLDIWNAIEDKSQNLMQLCSNPLFLTFVIMIHQYEKKPPKSFSGIIIQLLERHIRSNNRSMPSERITDILHKLKRLSYSALERRSVVFSIKDLDDSGLTPDDVKDLIIGSPNPSSEFDQLLMPKDFHYFFCHQAIQEAFAAQHVSEMDDRDFDHAVTNYLRGRSGLVVRQFTCGILFNEETSEASGKRLEESEKIAKREKIILVLEQDLVDHKDKPLELRSLLTSLRECGDDENVVTMVRKRLDAIRLSGISLTPSDIHAVGRVASHCKKLDIMQLVNCQLNRKSLETLVEVMKYSNVEVYGNNWRFGGCRYTCLYLFTDYCIRCEFQ